MKYSRENALEVITIVIVECIEISFLFFLFFYFIFLLLLNKYFIAHKTQPETGEKQKDRVLTHL